MSKTYTERVEGVLLSHLLPDPKKSLLGQLAKEMAYKLDKQTQESIWIARDEDDLMKVCDGEPIKVDDVFELNDDTTGDYIDSQIFLHIKPGQKVKYVRVEE